jgi:protein TonB
VTQAAATGSDRLLMAALIAGALHVLIILGVNFEALHREFRQQPIEVTLVQRPGKPPQEAVHIAQADQQGAGSEVLRDLASGAHSALPQPAPDTRRSTPRAVRGDEAPATKAVTSFRADRQLVNRGGEQAALEDLPETDRQLARLNEELARLQADLDTRQRKASLNPRVRRLDAVAARSAVDAAYLAEWRRRVEGVGNQYYPEASLRYGIYGKLRMLVTIRRDGQLENIEIISPSGHAVLDEAAIRIVRMAAPFPPFPPELAATTDKLEIVRTWQFEQNPLSSN